MEQNKVTISVSKDTARFVQLYDKTVALGEEIIDAIIETYGEERCDKIVEENFTDPLSNLRDAIARFINDNLTSDLMPKD